MQRGPGVHKVRAPRLFVHRERIFCAPVAGALAELLEVADVVSEGMTRDDAEGRVYYGSTSVLLAPPEGSSLEELTHMLSGDPHFRVRVLRVARREATSRAGGDLGPVTAEVTINASSRGVAIVIEVVAPLRKTSGEDGLRSLAT
jgi:hypothetical protein